MRILHSTYHDKESGQSKQVRKWYLEFRDHREVSHRIAGFTDKGQTQELGKKIEMLVMCRANGRQPDPELQRWFEAMSPSLVKRLAKIDLLETRWVASNQLLSEHLKDFKQSLKAKGSSERHVELVASRATKLVEGCGFKFWHDIQPSRVMNFLHELRQDKRDERDNIKTGISAQTFNFYLQAISGL